MISKLSVLSNMEFMAKIEALRAAARFDFDSDLFVEILASLIGKQHAIVTVSRDDYLDFVEKMILLIGSNIFGFGITSIICTPEMTTEEFVDQLLIACDPSIGGPGSFSPLPSSSLEKGAEYPLWNSTYKVDISKQENITQKSLSRGKSSIRGFARRLPNLAVIRNLDNSNNYVQAQLLEILRTKKLVSSDGFFITPTPFLVVSLLSNRNVHLQLFPYLLDHFSVSHNFAPANLDDTSIEDSRSVSLDILPAFKQQAILTAKDLETLSMMANNVSISSDVRRYIHDIIVHLRMHRAVRGGVSARASKDFETLIKSLCPLHGISFATPSLVVIATRKTYAHRIIIPPADDERSTMYGSDPEALKQMMSNWTPDLIIEDVLDSVPAPM
ncbi:hypothetical protein V1511DRAFT_500355 [Dipodascopsis uninucleata]